MNDEENKIEFIRYVHSNAQNMISLADSKANITLTIQSLLLGIGLGSTILSELSNQNRSFYFLFIAFITISIIGIVLSILVYKARSPLSKSEKKRKGLIYTGHIMKFPNSEAYYREIKELSSENMIKEYSKQAYHISKIISRKTNYLKYTIILLQINIGVFTLLMLSILYLKSTI